MAKKAALRPLGDRVVVKPVPRDEKTASGIILPDTVQEKPQEGEVVAVGPGRILDDGKREPIEPLARTIAENFDRIFPRGSGAPPRLELAL